MSTVEKHTFQAEVNQVLSIVVKSLYSHREVFLRELISNASDACDKLSFKALTDHSLRGEDQELKIEMIPSESAGTLLIRDNGVGMSKEELIDNLGTIARSGSKQLVEALSAADKDKVSLIGQFGVGFYSAFLVADQVTVTSRAAGADEAWQWQSSADGEFTVQPSEKETPGTNVILHIKDDAKEFLSEWQIKSLVRKYSDYVRYPIRLQVEREQPVGDEKDDDGNPVTEKVREWETINQASALWTRPKSEVSDEQYEEFYKHLSHDWESPLGHTHFKIEGTQELSGLLFLPKSRPFDMFERKRRGVRLFVKRVFIMEDCEEILPEWLRFVRGVVDSEDLPLNVSREILQQDRVTRAIRKQVTNKTLALLEELADEGETTIKDDEGNETKVDRYQQFWRNFGTVFKEGMHYEPAARDQITRLLRFESSREEGLTSLLDYVGRMKDDQPGIFYITADSLDSARNSPHLEALTKAGYEVLYMVDPVDDWVVGGIPEFEDKKLIAAAKGALDLPESDEDKKKREEQSSDFEPVIEKVKGALETKIKDVRLTNRLTDSPACLVSEEGAMSPHVERLLRAQGQEVPEQKRILELNPEHPVIQRLQTLAGDEEQVVDLQRWSSLLYDQAVLAEGGMPENPAAFAKAVSELMAKGL